MAIASHMPAARAFLKPFSRYLFGFCRTLGTKNGNNNTQNARTIKFNVKHNPGALQRTLALFDKYKYNMTRIESRPAKHSMDYAVIINYIPIESDNNEHDFQLRHYQFLNELGDVATDVQHLRSTVVPYFPRKIKELDRVASEILDAGAELQADHPGFSDQVYRQRRLEVASVAAAYRQGDRIPRVDYTDDEIKCWGAIYEKLKPLAERHACREYNRLFPLLEQNCGYGFHNIPQLQDVSDFLKDSTGFTIRPVTGLLSARNFLYGLAFRVFFCTQYLRHHSKPFYTPEPDLVHELMGHAPLFADKAFADFSQEIGLASIGASDAHIEELSRCYWFSVEFGICQQDGERKAYGAGLLSSFGEIEHAMSDVPEIRPFDPFHAAKQSYPITTFQPIYYSAKSFEDAKLKMQEFSASLHRPFNVRYDPLTQTIETDTNIDFADAHH